MKKPALTLVDKDTGTAPPPRPLGKHGDCAGREYHTGPTTTQPRGGSCMAHLRMPKSTRSFRMVTLSAS
jgi:hypothetical protein